MPERLLRLFVSSPSDVKPERDRVRIVADRLNGEFEGLAHIEVLRWEDAFYTAAQSFQEAIDQAVGGMTRADLVLCIVWSRVGLKLNPKIWQRPDGSAYESGTVLEFETALSVSAEHGGAPDVYLFRKTAPVLYRADRAEEEMQQHRLLEAVWKRWTETREGYNVSAYQTFADPDDFETKLEACLRQWLERRGVVLEGPVWDRRLKGSPFRGLAPFEASHAPVFFGREAATAKALAGLRRGAPFLLLIGASGSGKSSLLRSGLLPRIVRPGTVPGVDLWRTAVTTPTADPLLALAEALHAEPALGAELRRGDFPTPQLLATLLQGSPDAAVAPIRRALDRAAEDRAQALRYDAARPARLLLAADQLERLFVEAEPGRVEAFAAVLHALVRHKLAVVVAALRGDAYGRFQQVASLVALREDGGATLDLLPPGEQELEEIVTRPVAACVPPLAFEADARGRSLAEALVSDAKGGDALPLLQMTLERLFQAEARRGDGVLRFADYPGLDAAVTETAEEAFAGLDEAARAALPALLTAMVHDVDIDPGTKRVALTLVPAARPRFEHGRPERAALVDAFIARRLLTSEAVAGVVQVRPVHEALLRVWPEAVRILRENEALIRVRHTLAPMAAEWGRAASAEKPDYLVTSAALLAGAAQLAERLGEDLAPEMRAFIAASLAADARRRDAERRRQRRILAATAAGLVVSLVLAGVAGWQWREAESARRAEAEQARIAKEQRDRAERALAAATRTANALVFDLARDLRNRTGMPVALVRNILDRAQDLQRQLLRSGEAAPDLRRSEAKALQELVTTLLAQGDTKAALAAAEQARDIMQALVAAEPGHAQWQRDLSISHVDVGDALNAAGRREEALDSYNKSLAVRETLAAAEPGNAERQRDLSVSHRKIGTVLAAAGRREEALDSYRKSLAIREDLAAAEPGNAERQHNLAAIYDNIADVLVAAGRRDEALDSYRKILAIFEKLTAADPGNARWLRDLSVGHDRIGDVLLAAGRRDEALDSYRKSLAIRETLTAADPGNADWQRNVSVAHNKIGDVLVAAGRPEEALGSYRKSLAILEKLVTADPGNAGWQRGLSISHEGIGDVLAAAGRRQEALDAYRKSLAIREKLAASDPGNAQWQTDLYWSLWKVAHAGDDPRGHLTRALDILRRLEADEKLTTDQKGLISRTEQALDRSEASSQAPLPAPAR